MRASHIAALAALVASAVALPAPVPSDETVQAQGYTVEQVSTDRKTVKSGPIEVAKTYLKYTKTVPDNVANAASAVQSGSVSASPQAYNEAYLCPVQVGTPAQTLYLDFDTGSSDLWVFSSLMPSSQRSGHAYYTPGSSSTSSLESGETWSISYGDGSGAKGTVYSDKVVIGGVTATSQAVEAATSVSSSFVSNTANDGLVGLAFDDINTCSPTRCGTFMDSVVSTLPSPLFAAYLKYNAVGAYDFGFINSAHYTGTITYTPVIQKEYWMIDVGGYQIGSGAETTANDESIVDTGTTLIYLPSSIVKSYYAQVSGATNSASAGGYIFPCKSTLPSLTIYIGGRGFTVPGTHINYAPYSSTQCFGGVQVNTGIGFNILGDLFINNFYVVFDFVSESASSQIGFATQA